MRLAKRIHTTRNVWDAWDHCSPEERKLRLEDWVLDVSMMAASILEWSLRRRTLHACKWNRWEITAGLRTPIGSPPCGIAPWTAARSGFRGDLSEMSDTLAAAAAIVRAAR